VMSAAAADKAPVAVVFIMRGSHEEGMLRLHASVPYVSSLQHISYPYFIQHVSRDFGREIEAAVLTLQIEFSSGRLFGSGSLGEVPFDIVHKPRFVLKQGASYRMQLEKVARQIEKSMHLERIVDFLFSLEGQVELLQIFTDVPEIPWDWVLNKADGRLLCEVFGIGITTPEVKRISSVLYSRRDRSLTLRQLRSSDHIALIVGNSYSASAHPLPGMPEGIEEIAEVASPVFGADYTRRCLDLEASELRSILGQVAEEASFVFLSGHFTQRGFLCQDTFFGAQDVYQALEEHGGERERRFSTGPLIILNGCGSGDVGAQSLSMYVEPHKSLAQAFIRMGAVACVFTSARVRFRQAQQLTLTFLQELFSPGRSVGVSLLKARRSLDKERCFEWATYHLLGDPGFVMVRDGE